MDREQVRDRPIGHVWQHGELERYFAAVAGGVAFPGKRPGFAVIAGLRPFRQKDHYEIHVLDEVESPDMGELLRSCHGLIAEYHIRMMERELFRWYGDTRNTAAVNLMHTINGDGPRETRLQITWAYPVLNVGQPYAFMLTRLKEYLGENRKQLFLRGSRTQHTLTEVPPDELAELTFGDYPPVEALAFVVMGLRNHAERMVAEKAQQRQPQEPYNPLTWEL